MVRPAVDWVICRRLAIDEVVEDSRIPEIVRRAAEKTSLIV